MSRTHKEPFNIYSIKRTLKNLYNGNSDLLYPRNLSYDTSHYQFLRKRVSYRNKRISLRQIEEEDFKRYADQVRFEVMFEKEKEKQQSGTELHIGPNQPFFYHQSNQILPRGPSLGANHYDRDEENMIGENTYLTDGRMTVSEASLHLEERSSQDLGINLNPEAANTAVQKKQEMRQENEAVREQKREEYKEQNQIKFQSKPQQSIQNTQSIKNQVQIQAPLLKQTQHQNPNHGEMVQVEEQVQYVRLIQPLADQEAQYEALIVSDIEPQVERVVDQRQPPNGDDHPPAQLIIGQTINQVLLVAQHEVFIQQPEEMIQPPVPQQAIQEILAVQQNQNQPQQTNPFIHDNFEPDESGRVFTIRKLINEQLRTYQHKLIREQNQNLYSKQKKMTSYFTKQQKVTTPTINTRLRLENELFRVGDILCKMQIAKDGCLRAQRIKFIFSEVLTKDGPKIVTSIQPPIEEINLLKVAGIKKPKLLQRYLELLKLFKIVE